MRMLDAEKLAARIAAHAAEELADGRIGGKEIVVLQGGRQVYAGAFGDVAERDAGKPPAVYRLASMTKPVTAAAVLQLADRGLLDPDEPASRYYPQLAHMRVAVIEAGKLRGEVPAKGVIRVGDLLSHTSGIGCGPLCELLPDPTPAMPLREAIGEILRMPLAFDPRTAQAYSPTAAFDVAAGIVELVSGTPFDEYLRAHIFAPLGMRDTTFAPTAAQFARMAPMHDRAPDGAGVTVSMPAGCVFEAYTPARMAAGAGLASTTADYVRFAEMLRRGGLAPDGTRILSAAAVRRLRSPNVPAQIPMSPERWGLGVRVITGADYPHGLGIGCYGWSGAYGTHFWVDPENETSVVMMKNARIDGGAGNRSACGLERDVTDSYAEK